MEILTAILVLGLNERIKDAPLMQAVAAPGRERKNRSRCWVRSIIGKFRTVWQVPCLQLNEASPGPEFLPFWLAKNFVRRRGENCHDFET